MNINTVHHNEPEELLAMLRFCAHKLLIAYDETLQVELWDASEKAADACASLLPLIHEQKELRTIH